MARKDRFSLFRSDFSKQRAVPFGPGESECEADEQNHHSEDIGKVDIHVENDSGECGPYHVAEAHIGVHHAGRVSLFLSRQLGNDRIHRRAEKGGRRRENGGDEQDGPEQVDKDDAENRERRDDQVDKDDAHFPEAFEKPVDDEGLHNHPDKSADGYEYGNLDRGISEFMVDEQRNGRLEVRETEREDEHDNQDDEVRRRRGPFQLLEKILLLLQYIIFRNGRLRIRQDEQRKECCEQRSARCKIEREDETDLR